MRMKDTFVVPSGNAGEHGADLMEQHGTPMAVRAVAALAPTPGARILEIGFGPGLALELLAPLVPKGHLSGIDPSRVMHRRASARNALAIQAGHLDLTHGFVDHMPFAGAAFDAVLSSDNAHFWPNLAAGLAEISRVLRPGGILVVTFTPVSGGPPFALERALARGGFHGIDIRHTTEGVIFTARRPGGEPA